MRFESLRVSSVRFAFRIAAFAGLRFKPRFVRCLARGAAFRRSGARSRSPVCSPLCVSRFGSRCSCVSSAFRQQSHGTQLRFTVAVRIAAFCVSRPLSQQAEVTIGLLPASFPGTVAQWHKCRRPQTDHHHYLHWRPHCCSPHCSRCSRSNPARTRLLRHRRRVDQRVPAPVRGARRGSGRRPPRPARDSDGSDNDPDGGSHDDNARIAN